MNNIALCTYRWRGASGTIIVNASKTPISRSGIKKINDFLNEKTGYGINWFNNDEPAAYILYERGYDEITV